MKQTFFDQKVNGQLMSTTLFEAPPSSLKDLTLLCKYKF